MANELVAGDSGGLAISESPIQHLGLVAGWGNESPLKARFLLEDCWAIRRGQLHEVIDPAFDLLCHHFVHQPQSCYLCVTLIVKSGTFGLWWFPDVACKNY